MPGFERTQQAADLFAKLISCANPQCLRESDQLQTLGTACKHAFCWDCINTYSKIDTFTLCPRCACPLDIHRPRVAQVFNNLAQHINEFKVLLAEYENAIRNEGAAAAATIAQTQRLFEVHAGNVAGVRDRAARNEAIDEFISTQRIPDPEPPCERRESPKKESKEPKAKPAVEFAECFDDFSDDDEVTPSISKTNVITDSIPQLGEPMMTSTQKPSLFLSQAVHARSDLFAKEPTQEVKTYRDEKTYNYFRTKPVKTFDTKASKSTPTPWLDLPDKTRTATRDSTNLHREDRQTPKRGPKVETTPVPRGRRSSVSTPRPLSRMADDPVMTAVLAGDLNGLRDAIDDGYDVNQRDSLLRTPLYAAVELKRLDLCQLLVERGGAVINANCGAECNTALHVAVAQENEEIVRYLLSKGASKKICNIRQQTPSQLAEQRSPLRSLVEHYRNHPKQPYVPRLPDVYIVCFSKEIRIRLTYSDQNVLNKLMTVRAFQNFVEFCFTTHYVVACDADGVASVDADLLRAMMQNTRIMGLDWLNECIRCNEAVPHTNYEVSKLRYMEHDVVSDSLKRCRKSKERMEPGLFHGCIFYLLSNRYKGIDDRRLLPDLIRLGGGEIASREPEYNPAMPAPFHSPQLSSPIFIVYDVTLTKHIPRKFHQRPQHYNMVSAQWVIESVMEYAIKPVA
ncbi:hypothetical protein Q1695_014254 [Nippostrongylus brasiliensis]|nr:hypothetical protein Q1695_014254 [Nippostrongylus brasiliensis]